MNNFDRKAPIIPGKSMGGLSIGSHISEHAHILKSFAYKEGKSFLQGPFHVGYFLDNMSLLVYNVFNGKLSKISALAEYEGTLFNKIIIGMSAQEVCHILPDLYYDDEEEVFSLREESGFNIAFENPYLRLEEDPKNLIAEITVYDKSLLYHDFR